MWFDVASALAAIETSRPATSAIPATQEPQVAEIARIAPPAPQKYDDQRMRSKPRLVAFQQGVASWDQEDWHAFFEERAAITEFEGRLPRQAAEAVAYECCIIAWLNAHLVTSLPGKCLECGQAEGLGQPLIPFGGDPMHHVWLHSDCWDQWHNKRVDQAREALLAAGIAEPASATR